MNQWFQKQVWPNVVKVTQKSYKIWDQLKQIATAERKCKYSLLDAYHPSLLNSLFGKGWIRTKQWVQHWRIIWFLKNLNSVILHCFSRLPCDLQHLYFEVTVHLNNKSSPQKKKSIWHLPASFFFFEGCKQNLSLWCLVAFFSILLPKTESSPRCRNLSCHWPGSLPKNSSSSLSHHSDSTQFAPFSLPRGEDFSLLLPPCCFPHGFYHPLVYRNISRPISTNSPSSQCLHSSAALLPSVTLGWRCSHHLRQPGKYILLD